MMIFPDKTKWHLLPRISLEKVEFHTGLQSDRDKIRSALSFSGSAQTCGDKEQ